MSEQDKHPNAPAGPDGEDAQLARRLKTLGERLGDAPNDRDERDDKSAKAGYANAMRLSSEFIVAILIGTFIGWAIDQLAGTAPWAMIAFLLLGFAAGVVTVMRSAGMMADPRDEWAGDNGGAGATRDKNAMDNSANSAKNMANKRQ